MNLSQRPDPWKPKPPSAPHPAFWLAAYLNLSPLLLLRVRPLLLFAKNSVLSYSPHTIPETHYVAVVSDCFLAQMLCRIYVHT